MHATVPTTIPPPSAARRLRCDLGWALPGKPCTVSGPPGDHLARIITAVRLGLLSRAELAVVVAGLTVVADHVVILERAA
jgi:hypothetical protein